MRKSLISVECVVYSWSTWRTSQSWNVSTLLERNIKIQLKSFDTAVTLKYTHSHWKCYEWMKFNQLYHPANFNIFLHLYCGENHTVKTFVTSCNRSASLTLIIAYLHFYVSQKWCNTLLEQRGVGDYYNTMPVEQRVAVETLICS